jgi:hypothetical protein
MMCEFLSCKKSVGIPLGISPPAAAAQPQVTEEHMAVLQKNTWLYYRRTHGCITEGHMAVL